MSEEVAVKRPQQTVKISSYASKPFGWSLHVEYLNNEGKQSFAQIGFGPNPNPSSGIFPLWKSPSEPVVIQCPILESDPPLFADYSGDVLVPIPEMVIQTMFTGLLHAPKHPLGLRRT